MNHSTRSAAIPLAVALLALPGSAQGIPVDPLLAQGMFSEFSVGMTVGGVSAPDPLLIRAPGVNSGIPAPWTAGSFTAASQNHPNYSFTSLTSHWAPAAPNPQPSFGGISTGGEVMPNVLPTGEFDMVTNNWFMLSIAVDSAARGEAGSVLSMQTPQLTATTHRSAAGDILSYYFIGSQGINSTIVNHSFLESSREQLKLNLIPTPAPEREILNFDYGMGVISTDPLGKTGSMFPTRNCFYFTLTQDYVTSVPWLQLDNEVVNASTVYAMVWSGSPTPTWSQPQIAFTSTELFGEGWEGLVEIDALSVHKASGMWDAPLRAILSLTLESNNHGGPYDQVLVYQRGSTPEAMTLLTDHSFGEASQPFSQKIGLRRTAGPGGGPDEVRGTCGGDPPDHHVEDAVVALATDEPRTGPGTLGCSAMRRCPHDLTGAPTTVGDTLHIQVTGLVHTGWTFPLIQLYDQGPVIPPGTGKDLGPAPQTWGQPYLVDSGSVGLNAYEIEIPVPCTLTPMKHRFSATLYGLNFTPGQVTQVLGESCVLTIKL